MITKRFIDKLNQSVTIEGQNLIIEFFITFSRFECALKTSNFANGNNALSIRDVRNNLFHGGKFNGNYQKDVSRNYILLHWSANSGVRHLTPPLSTPSS